MIAVAESLLADAATLAAAGYRVFPCHTVSGGGCSCGRADCDSPGKHPRTRHGVHDATSAAEQIERWWDRWPAANIGIATGVNGGGGPGLHVIDVDDPLVWERLVHTHNAGVEPATLTARTGSGGRRHLYFSLPPDVRLGNTAGRIAPGIDTRGDGGYVIAPPSLHPSGDRYSWLRLAPIAPMPDALLQRLQPPRCSTPAAAPTFSAGTSPYGAAILRSCLERVASAPPGERNSTLAREAFVVGQYSAGGEIDPTGLVELLVASCPDPDQRKSHSTALRQLREGAAYPRRRPS